MKEEIKDPWCDPENPRIVSFENVSAAAFRIRDGIVRSPCDVSKLFLAESQDLLPYQVEVWSKTRLGFNKHLQN